MDKIDGMTMNIEQANVEKLKEIFPEVFADGKVDFDKLQGLLGNYIASDNEKYSFTWKGKTDSLRLAQKRSTGTLRPSMADSKNWDTTQNLYLEGDNLEVLKLLQSSYLNSVKMIYIDPPYNTGHDFVYNDSFADPISQYKEVTGQATRSNPETAGRYHTNWLNMMYPRLKLARNLLTDDGVIFISIDDNEVANLKKICDEIFGEDNFVAQLIWQRAFSPKNDAKYISNSHDYILLYCKTITKFKIGRLPRTEEANARYQNPDNDPRGVWTSSDLSVKTYNASYDYPIITPSGKIVEPPSGRCWRTSKESFEKLVEDNRVYFGEDGSNTPRVKRFLCELKFDGMAPTSILFHKDVGHSQEGSQEVTKILDAGVFEGPKPSKLLKRLLTLANTNSDSIILDFFSGSATTAHAVMQLNAEDSGNRKFICVQLPEKTDEQSEAYKAGYTNICEIGKERIRRAGEKIKRDNKDKQGIENLDIGFKVFKLDSSNLVKWDNTPTTDVEEVKKRVQQSLFYLVEGREDIDLVYEVMLKRGLPLTSTVKECVFDGVKAFFVNSPSDKMLICLDPVTISAVEKMAESTAEVCIFADRFFADANILSNTDENLKKKDKKVEMF